MKKLNLLILTLTFISSVQIYSQGIGCSAPIQLSGVSGSQAFNTAGYTNAQAFYPTGSNSGKDITYTLIDSIPTGYLLNIWVENQAGDPYINIITDSCNGSLINYAQGDELVSWQNITGQKKKVWIVVDQFYNVSPNASGVLKWEIVNQTGGNDCSNPISLSGASGSENISTSVNYAINFYQSTNCFSNSSDIVVQLTDSVPNGSVLRVRKDYSSYSSVIYGFYGTCGNNEFGCEVSDETDLIWGNNTGSTQPVWIVIDGASSSGETRLIWDVSLPDTGDNCGNAIVLNGNSGNYYFNTTASNYTDQMQSDSGCSNDLDIIFKLNNPIPDGYVVNYWTDSSTTNQVLYGSVGSCGVNQTECESNVNSWFNNTGVSQDFWITIDDMYSGEEARVNWNISPEKNGNRCSSAIAITGNSGSYIYNTDTLGVSNNYSGSCGGSGNDLVFELTTAIPADSVLYIWTTNDDYDVIIYGAYGACDSSASIGCHDDPDGDFLIWDNNTGSAQSVWIYVDGYSDKGSATLNWDIKGAPLSPCASAISLSGLTGSVNYNSSLSTYSDVAGLSTCNESGNDIIYNLTTPVGVGETINIWTSNDNYDVNLYAGYGTCTSMTNIICHDDPDGDIQTWTNNTSSPKNLWIIVDGYSSGGGTGTLNWEIPTTPVGANCGDPILLNGNQGSQFYDNNNALLSNLNLSSCNENGWDLVFKLNSVVPAGEYLRLWTTNDNHDVVFYAGYGNCASMTTVVCHDDPDGAVQTWYNNTGVDKTVFIVTDGYNGSNGSANLHWEIGTASSVEEINLFSALKVYPNPANDVINIKGNIETNNSLQLSLKDLSGKTIINKKLANNNMVNQNLNVSDLMQGMYLLEITDGVSIKTYKISIVK